MATGFTDFGEYSLGGLPAEWVGTVDLGSGSVEIVTLSGSVSGQALRLQRSASNFKALAEFQVGAGKHREGEVVALIRIVSGNNAMGAVTSRHDSSVDNVAHGTRLQGIGSSARYSTDVLDTVGNSATAWTPPAWQSGQRIWIRFNYRDHVTPGQIDIMQRGWAAADPEPGTWNKTNVEIPGLPDRAGYPGVCANLQGGSFGTTLYVEAFGWSDDPDVSAPTEAVTNEPDVTIDADIELDSTFLVDTVTVPSGGGGTPEPTETGLAVQATQGIRFNGRDLGELGFLATGIEAWADVPEEARAAAERIGLEGLLASSRAGSPSRDIPLAITIPDIAFAARDEAVNALVDVLGGRFELTFEDAPGKKLLATLQGMAVAAEVEGMAWTFGDVVCLARLLAAQPQPIEDVARVTTLPGAIELGTAPSYGTIHVVNTTGVNTGPFNIIYRDFRGEEIARLVYSLALSSSLTLVVNLATQEVTRAGTTEYSDFQLIVAPWITGDWFHFEPRHANLAAGLYPTLAIEKDDGTSVPGYLIHRRRWE